ncbi:hypothetical protein HZS_7784 [Henneguya salminicola]|nr:hypothetical protein HZS_7784 [Henneguya salminicola]
MAKVTLMPLIEITGYSKLIPDSLQFEDIVLGGAEIKVKMNKAKFRSPTQWKFGCWDKPEYTIATDWFINSCSLPDVYTTVTVNVSVEFVDSEQTHAPIK